MPKRLGEILRESGVIDAEQLEDALRTQRRFGGRLASTLLSLGYADERTLAMHLSRQQGVPFVVLSASAIPLELLRDFPLELAHKTMALPVFLEGDELFVAMADPRKAGLLDDLRFLTGKTVVEHGALFGPLVDTQEQAYRMLAQGAIAQWRGMDLGPDERPGPAGQLSIAHGGGAPIPTPGPLPATPGLPAPPVLPAGHPAATALGPDWVDDLALDDLEAPSPPPAPSPAPPARAGTPEPERARILVVEDEPTIRFMLGEMLRKEGYAVEECADGTSAVASLRRGLPAALVLDAMLPGVHGFDLCKRIKASPATRHVRVVMVSAVYRGWRYADDVRRLYGADAFLEKPLRLEELKRCLARLLDEQGPRAAPEELDARARQSLEAAALAFRQGDLAGAVVHLQAAIEAAPFRADLHHRLGLIYARQGDVYRSLASLDRAAELEPSLPHVLELARAYERAGFTHKAFEAWERCLRLSQDPAQQADIKAAMARLLP
jgi:CheY-like chemotaxis protein